MEMEIDRKAVLRQKVGHFAHSFVLLAGMALLLGLLAWIFAGPSGLWLVFIAGLVSVGLGRRISPRLIMKWHAARSISPQSAPFLYAVTRELARQANLPATPQLYLIPERGLNAFTIGRRDDAGIAMTGGLIQSLSRRELKAVLAHEISHLKNNDLWLMNLSGILGRVTAFLSMLGQFLLIINLPLMLVSNHHLPWAGILVLIFAPTLSMLLQLAVSRSREFSADIGAVELTADPVGLADALSKIEGHRRRWPGPIIFAGYRRMPLSMLLSHPQTEERIRRLISLTASSQPSNFTDELRELRGRPLPISQRRLAHYSR